MCLDAGDSDRVHCQLCKSHSNFCRLLHLPCLLFVRNVLIKYRQPHVSVDFLGSCFILASLAAALMCLSCAKPHGQISPEPSEQRAMHAQCNEQKLNSSLLGIDFN